LEEHGLQPVDGEVLVTGACGGVGSIAIMLLSKLGYLAAAVTGRSKNADYLKQLGAVKVLDRKDFETPSDKPLQHEQWGGAIDNVGGVILANVIGQMKSYSSVAACGLAASADVPLNIMPFLLRGINLLGVESQTCPPA